MTCDRFRETAVGLEEPANVLTSRIDLAGHAASCGECRHWLEQYVIGMAQGRVDSSADVTAAVMARTAGSACDRARVLLASGADDDVARDDRRLLRAHLDRCADCRAFDAMLAESLAALPALAELQPDAAFVADVLARTSRRPARAAWLDRACEAWQGIVQRPRFAWEAAYVCTLCWLLVFGQPMAAFDWTTARVTAVAQTATMRSGQISAWRKSVPASSVPDIRKYVPTSPVQQAAERLAGGRESLTSAVQSLWHRADAWALARVSSLVDALGSIWQSVAVWVADLFTPLQPGSSTHPSTPANPATEPPAAPVR